METNEIKNLDQLKKLIASHLNILNPSDKNDLYTFKIEVFDYAELGCIITNLLKMCILAVDQEAHKVSEINKIQPINVVMILEMILQMFPLDEFELLSEINLMYAADSQSVE